MANVPECFSLPPKDLLMEKLTNSLAELPQPESEQVANLHAAARRTVALMRKKPADIKWMASFVGIFNPGDEIFSKGWKFTRQRKVEVEEDYFSNDDDFYTGIQINFGNDIIFFFRSSDSR